MEMSENRFLRRLRAGERQFGFWASLTAPLATEVLATSGADWVCIDTEHAANELPDVIQHLRAIRAAGCEALVRPAWNDIVLMKRLLDAGATSFCIPYVQSAEEARLAVASTRYPPEGLRGVAGANRSSAFGRVRDYLARAHEEIAIIVQIETRKAMDALEAIAAVPGIDGILVGPGDLAASLGHLGDPFHPEVQAAIAEIGRRAVAAGCPAGYFCLSPEDADRALERGYSFLSLSTDLALVRNGADGLVRRFRGQG